MPSKDRFHPWRRMRDLGPSWKLQWSGALPTGRLGLTNFRTRTITLRLDLTFEERRCTITHEVEHAIRGTFLRSEYLREELEVDRISARLLLPSIRDVADAMVYHSGSYEQVAEDLWVDPWMLEVRLSSLQHLELGYFERRMTDVIVSDRA